MVQMFITLENMFLLFMLTAIMYGIMNSFIDSKNMRIVETEMIKKELKDMAKKNKKGTIEFQEVYEIPRVRFKMLIATSYSVYFITVIILAVLMGGN
jgi:ABC-type uncharacterized transport system permease subunit